MLKKDPADIETERFMATKDASASRTKYADIIAVAAAALIVFVFGTLIWALPHKTFSPDENRSLSSFPEFSLDSLLGGSYTSDIGSFYSDQFPCRRSFVGFKAVCELAQLKMQNNNVIPASGGNLVKRLEYSNYSAAEENLAAVADFDAALGSLGITLTVALAPRSLDVLGRSLPPLWGSDRSGMIWEIVESSGIANVDLKTPLSALAADGQYVWYKTDHHWTTLGAYEAYRSLAGALGYEAKPLSYFTVERVSDEFFGTTYSSSGMVWASPDSIDYYRFDGDEGYTVENMLTKEVTAGFYQTSFLETKDKYSSFLGQNSAHIRVVAADGAAAAKKPTLLLIKDSYAHSLAPFLALHFNLEIIDLRYYTGSAASLAADTGADAALILVGADTLAASRDLKLLRYGLSSPNR